MRHLKLVVSLLFGYVLFGGVASLAVHAAAKPLHLNAVEIYALDLVGGVLGIGFMAWRWVRKHGHTLRSTIHGSAQFASKHHVKTHLVGDVGLIIGRENKKRGKLLRYTGAAHLLTIAPTRSGKGVGAVIPNLLTADRSVLCIDPKGENARITALTRAKFGPVYVLDPFEISGRPGAAFNPLSALDPLSPDLAEDAALLADALVYDPPGQSGDAHWNEEAKALITGLILYVACHSKPTDRNLNTIRHLLTCSSVEAFIQMKKMEASDAACGLIRRAANRHMGKSERERSGVLSTAQRHTHFLDSARINATMARSDFHFADLKQSKATVFLVLPPERLDTYARWLRLMVSQGIHGVARAPSTGAPPILFFLDEFAALGRMEAVERAFGLMAGYGLQLWPILQDKHQLWSIYGQRAGTFMSNAGVVQIFNVGDVETASWISKTMGSTTMTYQTTSTGTSTQTTGASRTKSTTTSTHHTKRDLMTPDEIMRMDPSLEILLQQGQAAVIAGKVRYYAETEFQGLF